MIYILEQRSAKKTNRLSNRPSRKFRGQSPRKVCPVQKSRTVDAVARRVATVNSPDQVELNCATRQRTMSRQRCHRLKTTERRQQSRSRLRRTESGEVQSQSPWLTQQSSPYRASVYLMPEAAVYTGSMRFRFTYNMRYLVIIQFKFPR